jgi:tetratricopeptide (TPR) repeat protein
VRLNVVCDPLRFLCVWKGPIGLVSLGQSTSESFRRSDFDRTHFQQYPSAHRMKTIHLLLALALFLAAGCSREAKTQRAADRARQFFEAGEFEKAAIEYLNVLRRDPSNQTAIQRIGIAYFEQGDMARAFPYLQEATRLDPENPELLRRMGVLYVAARENTRAHEVAEFLLNRNPADQTALLLLGDLARTPDEIERSRILLERVRPSAANQPAYHLAHANLHLKSGQTDQAEKSLQQAYQIDPTSQIVLRTLGDFFSARNDAARAAEFYARGAQDAPIASQERMRLIEFKVRAGKLEEAKRMLDEVEKASPGFIPGLLLRARIALGERQYDECVEYTRKVLRRDRFNIEARVTEARAALGQGQPAKAREGLESFRTQFPDVPLIHYNLALTFLAENDLVRAIARLSEAIRLNPEYDEAIHLLAQLEIRSGNVASGVAVLQQLLARNPHDHQGQLLLAMAYRVRGTHADAVEIYQELLQQRPNAPQLAYLLGTTYRQQNKNQEARVMFERIIDLAPNNSAALSQIVELDIVESKFADSLRRLQSSIAQDPEAPWLRFLLAQVCLAQKDHAGAERALLETLERSPDHRPAYLLLAQLYIQSGRSKEALEKLDRTLEKNPDDAAALMEKAAIHEAVKDYASAAEAYEKIIKLNPNAGLALNNLAYLYAEKLGSLDRAHELALRARALLSDTPHVADTLGWIYYKRKEYERALLLLRESAEALPTEPVVLYHLGMTYYMQGEAELARNALRQALDLKKEFAEVNHVQERLAVLDFNPSSMGTANLPTLEAQFSQNPDDVILGLKIGQAHESHGQLDQARAFYERLLQNHPSLVPAMASLARVNLQDAARMESVGRLLRHARTLAPNDPHLSYMLAQYAYRTGDYKWSLNLLQESAGRFRRDPGVQFELGRAYLALGQLDSAKKAMQTALSIDEKFDGSAEARVSSELLDMYGNIAAARRDRAAALFQEWPELLPALLVAGRLDEQEGRITQARSIYERILARYPDFSPAAKHLAGIYSESGGNLARAQELALRAREALPADAELSKVFGKIVYLRGDYRYAATLLEQRATLPPEDPEVFFYLGMANYHLKKETEAKAALNRAISLGTNAPFGDEARLALARLNEN